MGLFGVYRRPFLRLSLFVLFFMVGAAHAEFGEASKWGIDLSRLENNNSGEFGVLLGFKHVGYFDASPVYLGYEIHTGTARGGSLNQDNLTYGGLSLGFDGSYFRTIAYDFNVLLGYGFGNVTRESLSGQSMTIQPTVALGLIMVGGFRASFSAGYLYMPGANGFSTPVFGIRIDRKTFSSGSVGSSN